MLRTIVLALALATGLAGISTSDAGARPVTVRWSHPDATGVTTFRVYLRTPEQSYGTPVWQGLPTPSGGIYSVVLDVADDATVHTVGTAVNSDGESAFSNELTFAPPAPVCGDGFLDAGESCDDGNTAPGDGCRSDCTVEACGDGFRDAGEACDDGNLASGDGCSSTCTVERIPACGDGFLDAGESCDDGNTAPGDGCRSDCTVEACGDGFRDAGEACDDGNLASGDGCSSTCTVERIPACGDGFLDAGESCDDGNTAPGDGCRSDCTVEACGDARLDPTEQCDDGNATSGDGCRSDCTIEACGDGVRDAGEACDDGNATPGDGCRADCSIEACGDALLDAGEACDDGNATPGDGCRADCSIEACGDGRLDPDEQCDDGNATPGDGCDAACQAESPVCGDGRLDPDEQCDDGNATPGDGCDAACQVENVSTLLPLRINVGGPDYTDPAGLLWRDGASFVAGGSSATSGAGIRNTRADPLYQSRVYGETGDAEEPVVVELPVDGEGLYRVRLHFAEVVGSVRRGQRVFDVLVEEALTVRDIDAVAQVGSYRPLTRELLVYVTDPSLSLRLVPKAGRPMLSGVELERADDEAAAAPEPRLCSRRNCQ